jgi:hypothetical protein
MAKHLKITWIGSEQAESRLRAHGVDFSVVKLRISQLNIPGTRELQTRFDSFVDGDHALNLAEQIENSLQVERLVALVPETGMKGNLIADGNHRLETFINDLYLKDQLPPDFQMECYLVDTQDKYLRDLIARSFNCIADKKSLSVAHRILHVKYLIDTYNKPIAELAKWFGVSAEKIRRELANDIQRNELRGFNVRVDNLTDSHLQEIVKIRQNGPLKVKFAQVVAQYGPTATDAGNCADQMVEALARGGEPAAMQVLVDYKKRWVEEYGSGKSRKKRPKRTAFRSGLGSLHQFLKRGPNGEPYVDFGDLGIKDEHDVAQIRQIWKDIRKCMETLFRNWDAEHKRK